MTPGPPTRSRILLAELWRGVRGGLFWSTTIGGGYLLLAGGLMLSGVPLADKPKNRSEFQERAVEACFMLVGVVLIWTTIAGVVGLVRGLERAYPPSTVPESAVQEKARKWRMLRCVLAGTTLGLASVLLMLAVKPGLIVRDFWGTLGCVGMWATLGWLVGLCLDAFHRRS